MKCPVCGLNHRHLKDCKKWVIPDAQLVVQAQAGDTKAFGELYTRYKAKVMQTVASYVGEEAEDVAQQVFIDAFKGMPRFRGEATFSSWIFTLARNAGYRAKMAKKPSSLVDPADVEISAGLSNPLTELEADEEMERVDRAFRMLPDGYREALALREFSLLTERQISDVMGLPVSTIKSRLNKGRKAMGLREVAA